RAAPFCPEFPIFCPRLLALSQPAREDRWERTMMEIPTTQEFRDHVRRQMLDEAKRQLDRVNGAAGTDGGGNPHRPTALREGGSRAPIWNSRKAPDPKARPVQGGKSVNSRTSEGRPDFDYVVHTNHAAS